MEDVPIGPPLSRSSERTRPWGAPVVLTERYAEIGVPVATYEASASEAGGAAGATTGAVGGAVAGALIGGPIGAVAGAAIGGAAGGVSGAATGAVVDAISPPDQVTTYVRSNPGGPGLSGR